MSRSYKLIQYKKGKPIYSRNLNKEATYRWFRKERSITRRKIYRGFRKKQKYYYKKFREYIPFINTNGWETW